eukprot:scaffold105643_cov32-Tisochrysis_lutea.AAC.1
MLRDSRTPVGLVPQLSSVSVAWPAGSSTHWTRLTVAVSALTSYLPSEVLASSLSSIRFRPSALSMAKRMGRRLVLAVPPSGAEGGKRPASGRTVLIPLFLVSINS